ncbi:MAG: alternative ribosome rescue aminoacyl-tRNA hydrolase ArfB [Chloroflexi bacterium]|nr:alternative ribosome rescue aminoacyl-tRNA hydrolase ArfB [Chloroflexota bacterium]
MIVISPTIRIEDNEITLDFIRSSGPGGQNVNKVATAVQLRFDLRNSTSLPDDIKERLSRLAAGRLTGEGILLIEAKRFRTQEQNRTDAILRLTTLIQRSVDAPKKRYATRPTLASKTERIQSKKRHGAVKKMRRNIPDE